MKCEHCGMDFAPRTITQRYCCAQCGYAYRREHPGAAKRHFPSITFHCSQCGRQVTTDGVNDMRTKFCSHECEQKFWKHSKRYAVKRLDDVPIMEFDCANCGKHVVTQGRLEGMAFDRRTRFCSKECRIDFFRHKKHGGFPVREFFCANCGEYVVTQGRKEGQRSDRRMKFCCAKCCNRYHSFLREHPDRADARYSMRNRAFFQRQRDARKTGRGNGA